MIPIYRNICELDCGRIRDLPQNQQAAFAKRLDGQTRPLVENTKMEDQDYFYICDYNDWIAGRPITD